MSEARANKDWISRTAAVDAAKQGVLDYALDKDPAMKVALRNGNPDTPLLVERLDEQGKAYYLVPWRVQEGVVLVVKVNASNGVMLGATTFPKPTPSPFLTQDQALNCVVQQFPERVFGKPRLVWQSCRQSTDPMLPFYEIPLNSGFLYVGMDGSVFTEPTPLGFGG